MPSFFPAQYSTLSAIALQNCLIDRYQLHKNTQCKLLIRNVSDTYLLENDSEKFIFKIYRDAHRKREEIEAEVELLNCLKADGNSVGYPITDQNGQQIQQFNAVEGIRNGVLFSYAKGKVIHDLEPNHLISLGTDMAKIHQTTSKIKLAGRRPVFDFQTTLIQPLETLHLKVPELKDELTYLTQLSEMVMSKFETFDTRNFSVGYCHYDFFPKNFHFDEQGKITFFDFDFAGTGYLVNDLMSFLNHYFFHQVNNMISSEQAEVDFKLFLDTYMQYRPLSQDEIAAIPYLGICFHIFFLKFFYDNYDDWSNVFLTPKYVKFRVELIRKWEAMYCL
ncbi:phosphotransferase enzyme family protein [Pedobacter sp. AW1-32]|uniref:phosphotransferase enzyme family protein n=1 Tax=Pedobacter sp. AW1-32 TaxID=3383026 RepID=UPI003FF0230D